jgi:hypothetical protein
VIGFDHETAVKRNPSIVSAITVLDLPDGTSILLVSHEGICDDTYSDISNKTSNDLITHISFFDPSDFFTLVQRIHLHVTLSMLKMCIRLVLRIEDPII